MALEQLQPVLSELSNALFSVDAEGVEEFENLLVGAATVFLHGMGRSCLNAKSFAMRLMHLGLRPCVVGDVLTPPIREGDLLIVVSASCSSSSLLCISREAKRYGAKLAVITTNPRSELSEIADCVIEIKAPTKAEMCANRGSITPMGTLFEASCYLLFDVVVLDLMKKLRVTNEEMVRRHANLE